MSDTPTLTVKNATDWRTPDGNRVVYANMRIPGANIYCVFDKPMTLYGSFTEKGWYVAPNGFMPSSNPPLQLVYDPIVKAPPAKFYVIGGGGSSAIFDNEADAIARAEALARYNPRTSFTVAKALTSYEVEKVVPPVKATAFA